ncbi:MAG: hypothetical protein JJU40_14550, partial [Rhodobacteraceae bacterium]|nr:hypothetical protein [Paracoccaceae bacterium]
MPRFARQHTRCTERNRKINDLADGGESFSGQPLGSCTRKTVLFHDSETVFGGANGERAPLSKTLYPTATGP